MEKQRKKIEQLNLKVIEKDVKNVQRIICTVSYSVIAKYAVDSQMWSYLAYKGPLFLVEDKLKNKKLIILNQCSTKNYTLLITENYRWQLKEFENGNFMLNYVLQDSIQGLLIKGIWTQDPAIRDIHQQCQNISIKKQMK